jgi:ABC-type sugar transport system, permease component
MSIPVNLERRKKRRMKDTRGEKVFYCLNTLFITFFFILTLYPILCLISSAISDPVAVYSGQVTFFPVGFSLEGFRLVFQNQSILQGFENTLIYTFGGTLLNVIVTVITAYALSRRELWGRGVISFIFAFTMWFSGGTIPMYLLVRDLGLFNTRWAMILPTALSIWNMIVCRTYIMSTIPEEMFQAASIDGCGYIRFLVSIVLPLSGAIIAILTLWYTISHWNAYFNALIFLLNRKLYPLQLHLRAYLIDNEILDMSGVEDATEMYGTRELMKSALILLSCIPLWVVYPFVQKFFVKGVMVGSVKG